MSSGLNNTTSNKTGRNLKYEKENIELRRAAVFELNTIGYSQADIADKLGVSVGLVNSDIKYVYKKAKDDFHTFQQEELPKEFKKAITTYDYVIKKAAHTAETTDDEKIRLQALHEVRETRTTKMDLISNHDVMSYQVSKNKSKEVEEPDAADISAQLEETEEQSKDLTNANRD